MAQRAPPPQKVGKYERPAFRAAGIVLGGLACILVLLVLAIIIF